MNMFKNLLWYFVIEILPIYIGLLIGFWGAEQLGAGVVLVVAMFVWFCSVAYRVYHEDSINNDYIWCHTCKANRDRRRDFIATDHGSVCKYCGTGWLDMYKHKWGVSTFAEAWEKEILHKEQ